MEKIRLECLRIAASVTPVGSSVVDLARQMENYIYGRDLEKMGQDVPKFVVGGEYSGQSIHVNGVDNRTAY